MSAAGTGPGLDALSDALVALEAAAGHGYSLAAAHEAARVALDGLERDQLVEAAAAVAGLAAWWTLLDSWQRGGHAPASLAGWVRLARCRVAAGQADP